MTRQLKFAGVVLGIWALSCAEYNVNWEGSVDAVFRYRPQDSTTAVVEVRPHSFAEEAGLKTDDLILAVDGTDVTAMTFDQVRAALRGPVGSTVRLTVKRNDAVTDLSIERRPISKSKN